MSTCTLEVSVSPPGADEAEVDVEHSKDEPDKPQPHNPTSWSRRLSSRFAVVLVACLVGLVLVTAGSVATWRAVKNPTGTAVNDASDSLTLAFVQEDGKGCRDAAIFYTLATSIELCQAKCASLSRCAGFAYHKEKQSCNILKGQCLTTVTSQVHVLGMSAPQLSDKPAIRRASGFRRMVLCLTPLRNTRFSCHCFGFSRQAKYRYFAHRITLILLSSPQDSR